MVLVLVVAVLAVAVAVVRGGDRLARVRVRATRLLVVAAGLQICTAVLAPQSHPLRVSALVVSGLLVALFILGNWHLAGVPLIGLGLLLNAVVVVLNLGMPVSLDAAARAGLTPAELRLAEDPLHEAAGPHTRLGRLGDTVPVALPWRPQVVSPGDVLASAGVGLLFVAGAAPARPRRPPQNRVGRPAVLARESTTRGSYS